MKRFISMALILMLCLSLVAVTASAASANASLTGPGTVRAGDTITLTFNLGGSGIFGASGALSYDSSQLTLTGTSQKIGNGWAVEFNGNNFVAYDNNLASSINGNTALFTATFTVNGGLSAGTAVNVSYTGVTVSDGNADIGGYSYLFCYHCASYVHRQHAKGSDGEQCHYQSRIQCRYHQLHRGSAFRGE